MGIVDDLMRLQSELAAERTHWESAWRDCVELCLPFASHRYDFSGGSTSASLSGLQQNAPQAARRSREIYDATAVWAGERLTAGMESLIAPRAQKWHGFNLDDPFGAEPNDVEEEWLDKLRDYHFAARYDTRSNFALANQKAIRSSVILGTGILYQEENVGRKGIDPVKVPFFYRHVPVIECYLGIDAFDDVDRCIRVCEFTARSAVAYFGSDKVSQKVRDAAENIKDSETKFTFMHAVLPREEAGEFSSKTKDRLFASFWVEVDTKHLVSHSGFFSFPYHVMWWDQVDNSPYGQSAPMAIISDIKMLQAMSKSAVQASQMMVKPPLATMSGMYNKRLNLNPGAVNGGFLDDSGRMKAAPIVTNQNPSLLENLLEVKRAGIRESMYVNLFQVLIQNPQQTATEALIKANEKGELLGPAGAKIEAGLARAVDREVDIVQRKGAFEAGSPLEPPASLQNKAIGVRFTGPLARLRRMQELQGVESVIGIASGLGQYDQSVLDRIDTDETLELVREIRGAPRKMFRTDEEVAQIRADRAQQMEQQAALTAMEQMSNTAKNATPAIQAAMGRQ
ncbi:portal protein [Nitratireductor basaltis]|uniref:Putative Head-to-tail joining protein n=1 Tax=Nitratireductor basaltis TaxID=472175 RepID=A0A084UDK0_9HYPH|nr:portal protein [Nitratireductor basaltis]KFB11036.1 putative Head-to-tail joining protein [Nitratireductor basaltis]